MFEYIPVIREHYENLTPRIMSAYRWVTPYSSFIEWYHIFSTIEEQTWMALRGFGQIALYPQYPVGRFFTDFGNPKLRIAIECDGKEWHLDKEKDAKRDNELLQQFGWHVYRINGAGCFRSCPEYYDRFDDGENYTEQVLSVYYTTVDGLIKALAIFYGNHKDYSQFDTEINLALRCLIEHLSPVQHDDVVQCLYDRYSLLSQEYGEWEISNSKRPNYAL